MREPYQEFTTTTVDRVTGYVLEEFFWSELKKFPQAYAGPYVVLNRPEKEGPAYTHRDEWTGNVIMELYIRDGVFHRDAGPAYIRYDSVDGSVLQERYFRDGCEHRDPAEGPSSVYYYDGDDLLTKEYRLYGLPYRDPKDGPWCTVQQHGLLREVYCKEEDLFDPSQPPPNGGVKTAVPVQWWGIGLERPGGYTSFNELSVPAIPVGPVQDLARSFSAEAKVISRPNSAPTRLQRGANLLRSVFRPILARR